MNGCKFCPAHDNCSVTYRGSSCAAIRYYYGLEDDPEIVTNGDRIRGMSDEELSEMLSCWDCVKGTCPLVEYCDTSGIIGCKDNIHAWLQEPAEEKK